MKQHVRSEFGCRGLLLVSMTLVSLALSGLGCAPGGGTDGPSEEVVRHNIRGTAFLGQQKWSEAEAEFRKALELAPGDPTLVNNIAVAKIQQGEIEAAEEALSQALALSPDHPFAHYNTGLVEKNRGNFEAASMHFEVVAEHDPLDLLTQYNLGVVYSRIGRNDDARRAFEAALARDPAHVSTLYGLGRLLLQSGEQEEGVRLVSLSQEIRARSGLDEAVGSQYGEQGPYAMGIDYPGDVLAAPKPIPVTFDAQPVAEASAIFGVHTVTFVRTDASVPTALVYASGDSIYVGGGDAPIAPAAPSAILNLAAGDIDQDDAVELVAIVAGSSGLEPRALKGSPTEGYAWRDKSFTTPESGTLTDSKRVLSSSNVDTVLLDRDHDGDLDAFWCWASDAGSGCALATNDGSGNFEVRPAAHHGFDLPTTEAGPVRVAFSDIDNDRDVDLLVAEPGGLHLLSNQRDNTYADLTSTHGLAGGLEGTTGLVVVDLNKDGFMDLLLGGPDGVRLLVNRNGRFAAPEVLVADAGESTLVVTDYDNDGFLDVVASQAGALPRVLRNLGRGAFAEAPRLFDEAASDARPLTAFDADADGDLDLVVRDSSGRILLLGNQGGNAHRWIAVDSAGVGDNTEGIGAKVEIMAGALRQKFEVTDGRPIHAGLGTRKSVESLRYLWPSGVLQDELDQPAGDAVEIVQLDRKGTSCPLLYAWGDDGWRFVTDFLGGAAVGSQRARGVFGVPDTDEYVKIEGGIAAGDDGMLRVRMNNQLEEVLWFDQVELLVVDHPEGTEVFPNERLMPKPPFPEYRLYAGADIRPVAAAHAVKDGRDLGSTLRDTDGQVADNFRHFPFKGYAETHTIELDLGRFPANKRAVLLLDGWIDYADSSSNIAAEQAGVALLPPVLSVADGRGGWTKAHHRMGFPAGLPKTMAVDLSGLFADSGGVRKVRIRTNMRIYWDRIRVLVGGEDTPLSVQRLAPAAAELRFGGFPRGIRLKGPLPLAYDPEDVMPTAGWKAHVGAYTAFGDVRDLLQRLDDRMVTTRNGDEIELAFPSPGPVRTGFERSFIVFADGFGKDMDPNSAASGEVAPVPFHGMTEYPYGEDVHPPIVPDASGPSRIVLPSPAGWPGAQPFVPHGDSRRGS